MSLYDEILEAGKNTLANSLSDYPDTPVIYAHQTKPEPTKTYATVYLLNMSQTGRVTKTSRLSSTGQLSYEAPYEATMQFNFLGKDSPSISFSSHMRMANSVLNREYSQARNLSIIRKTDIKRIPQKRDSKYVELLTYDVTFSFIVGFTETIGSIEQVVIEDTIQDVEIQIPADITP